jgi:hypothetical protein
MTAQDTSTGHSQVAREAALIATFYGRRGGLQSLQDRLVQELNLSPLVHNDYTNKANNTFLRHFDPPAASAHDTTIVQLALNMPGPVGDAWTAMREQLEKILPSDEILSDVWGYTLIYQAELVQGITPATAQDELLPVVRRLYSPPSERPQKLAGTDMAGGWIGLIDIPLQGDGLKAAMVYMALSQPDSNNQLVREVLYNPAAALLMADLIAHKGYHQMRQYRLGDLIDRYRQQMHTLLGHTDGCLKNPAQATESTAKLDVLGKEYSSLVIAVAYLRELQVSLIRQQSNFNWWCKQAGGGDVVTFHQQYLEEASQELELLVAEGRHPLEAAKMTVDVMGAKLDKEQERKQQRIETILTAAAAILGVLTLIDKEAAKGLLELAGVPQPVGILSVLGVQFGFVALATALAWIGIRLIRARRPNRTR